MDHNLQINVLRGICSCQVLSYIRSVGGLVVEELSNLTRFDRTGKVRGTSAVVIFKRSSSETE